MNNKGIYVYDDLIELYGWGKAGFLSHLINLSNHIGGPIKTTYRELARRIHLTDRRVREYMAEFTRLGLVEITRQNDGVMVRVNRELCEKYHTGAKDEAEAEGMKKFQGGYEKISGGGGKNFIPYEAETLEKSSESHDAKINNKIVFKNQARNIKNNSQGETVREEDLKETSPVRAENPNLDTSPVREATSKPVNVEPVGVVAELMELASRIKEMEGGEEFMSALNSLGWSIRDNDFASKYALTRIPRLFGGLKECAEALREYKGMYPHERFRASISGEFWRRLEEWGKGYLLQKELKKTGIDFRTFKLFKEIIAYTKREVPKELVKKVLMGWYFYTRPVGITLDDVRDKIEEIEREKESQRVGLAF
jgi:hypothetical protein